MDDGIGDKLAGQEHSIGHQIIAAGQLPGIQRFPDEAPGGGNRRRLWFKDCGSDEALVSVHVSYLCAPGLSVQSMTFAAGRCSYRGRLDTSAHGGKRSPVPHRHGRARRPAAEEDSVMIRAAGNPRRDDGNGTREDNGISPGRGPAVGRGTGRYTDADLEPIRAALAAFARGDLRPRAGRASDRREGAMLAEIGQLADEVGGQLASLNSEVTQKAAQVRDIALITTAVARGDLTRKVTVDAQGEMLQLKQTVNTMVDQLSAFADEVTRVARGVGTEGRLGGQAYVRGVSGVWKDLTDNVNFMAGNLTGQVRNIAQVTTAVANGDLSKKIDVDARGEILELKTTINTMVDQLSAFAAEVTRVAREVGSEGRLGGQAEVEGVSGTWKRLTENVNELAGNLTRQVRAIAEVTSAVASGDLTRSISVEAQGEVAELKDNINAMVQSLRETIRANQQQDWLKTNLAQIAGMMQGHRDLAVVAELIMDELVPLVGAQHGTFFLSEATGSDTQLRLIAGYGLRADKDEGSAPIQYLLGQSLIGQVAKSKRSIVITNLPQGYVKISSGLGEAPPANLAVLPILFEDQVLGVIELASFNSFSPVQTDFLEQLTETLGVNFNTIIANARTDALLEESQRLTTELQARSEELQDQQVELQRSNAELEEKAALLAAQNRDIETKNAEIEQARQEIEERARQLALASKYKSQFLANMSHELRTPLNSLLILARLLAQNPGRNLTAKQVEYANVIHSAGSDLLQLINDILDLSKVEAGRMDIHAERFPLSALLEDMQATFQPLTAEKGLDFSVEAGAEAPGELLTDRQRLRQVLGNLLANAVKFTERGHVLLRVAKAGRRTPDGGEMLAFSVGDTGIGIAPENLTTIFGAFQQGDGTLSRRYGGTGLGLSIAREVGALHGGEITAESELGRGSTFTLYLPCGLPGAEADGTAAGSNGVGAAHNGEAHAGATEALQLQPAVPDDTAAAGGRRLLVLEGARAGLLTL